MTYRRGVSYTHFMMQALKDARRIVPCFALPQSWHRFITEKGESFYEKTQILGLGHDILPVYDCVYRV